MSFKACSPVRALLQSPSGDSMFSDTSYHYFYDLAKLDSEFQSPCGDSLFSDGWRWMMYKERLEVLVSIP